VSELDTSIDNKNNFHVVNNCDDNPEEEESSAPLTCTIT